MVIYSILDEQFGKGIILGWVLWLFFINYNIINPTWELDENKEFYKNNTHLGELMTSLWAKDLAHQMAWGKVV